MTFGTIGGVAAFHMVGAGCGQILVAVAINTFNTKRVEAQQRSCFVTIVTVGCNVCPEQRETAMPVNINNVANNP